MKKPNDLTELTTAAYAHKGSWKNAQLAQDIKMCLWETYDPNDNLIYPTVNNWSDLLTETIENNGYDSLTKDEVLSTLFGLIHRTRIVSGLWESMFERGVIQELLARLLTLDID